MGSRSKIDFAYIAGFLDGDGSLMLQLKKRKDGALKYRFMTTICFYQDTRHEEPLSWIRDILGIGYISRRNDGMTELRINGFVQTKDILQKLLPHIKFKKRQAEVLYKACQILACRKKRNGLNKKALAQLIQFMLSIQQQNYVTKKKKRKEELMKILGLTP